MKNSVRMVAAIAAVAMLSGCGIFKGGGKKTPVLGQRVPILASENEIIADTSLRGVEVLLPPAETNDSWTQPGGNPSKSMGHLGLGESLSRVWEASIPGSTQRERLASSPVVADNKLFVIDPNGTVHAFAADTGARLWEADTAKDKENRNARFGGGVSVDGGRVYATNGLGDVVAFDASNGAEVWRAHPGGPLRGAPTVAAANGQLYVLSQDNQLFALGLEKGDVMWTASASLESQGVFGVAAPAVAQGTIVAGFSSGELNAYRYENGTVLWGDVLSRSSISTSVSSLSDIDAEPVIDQGRVYAVGQGGRMVAMDITSGNRLWEQNFGGISTPWVVGEWVFVVTDDAQLVCVQRGTGKVRWIKQFQHFKSERPGKEDKKKKGPIAWTGPVVAGNRLILLNSEGQITSVSPADGSVISTMEVKGKLTFPPVVANNTLYVLDQEGRITAYR